VGRSGTKENKASHTEEGRAGRWPGIRLAPESHAWIMPSGHEEEIPDLSAPSVSWALNCDFSGLGKFKLTDRGGGGGDHTTRTGKGQQEAGASGCHEDHKALLLGRLRWPCSFIYGLCGQFAPCWPVGRLAG
jgi:hypothetical protein